MNTNNVDMALTLTKVNSSGEKWNILICYNRVISFTELSDVNRELLVRKAHKDANTRIILDNDHWYDIAETMQEIKDLLKHWIILL